MEKVSEYYSRAVLLICWRFRRDWSAQKVQGEESIEWVNFWRLYWDQFAFDLQLDLSAEDGEAQEVLIV